MSNEEFRRAVTEAASYLGSPGAVEAAVTFYTGAGNTQESDVSECVDLASHLKPRFAVDPAKGNDPLSAEADAAVSLNSSNLRGMIAPGVEKVRLKLFGAAKRPFSSWKKAAAWLAELGAREERSPGQLARARRLWLEWGDDPRKKEVEEIMSANIRVSMRPPVIPYVAPNTDQVVHVAVHPTSPFVSLGVDAKQLSDDSGFSEASVVLHILCDFPLMLPSIRVTKSRHFRSGRGTVLVEFNSPDVTQKQIATVLAEVRDFWGKSARRRTSPEDVRFLDIIQSLGGVPASERVRFFESVREICMQEGVGSYDKSGWRGPYRRWKRLVEREPALASSDPET